MKKIKRIYSVLFFFFIITSCTNEENNSSNNDKNYFLSDIRPNYFENLNFQSNSVKSNTYSFLETFKNTFDDLELKYLNGQFTSNEDLENMRLVSQYFSFYCIALTGSYLDGNLDFQYINGNRTTGLFSNLSSSTANYDTLELKAMMQRAVEIIERAVNINGYNDKVYGFYVAVKQIQGKLNNNNFADPVAHARSLDYASIRLVNYDIIENWNVLMAMVTLTNYQDSLNTFDNPKMQDLLINVNARLNPGLLPDLGGKYPEILGPLYRFDLNFKKIDWMLNQYQTFTTAQIRELDNHINILNTATTFIENEQAPLLNSWMDKDSYYQRLEKFNQIKLYRQNMATQPKPELSEFINSNDFKKAYQCYSCHAPSGL